MTRLSHRCHQPVMCLPARTLEGRPNKVIARRLVIRNKCLYCTAKGRPNEVKYIHSFACNQAACCQAVEQSSSLQSKSLQSSTLQPSSLQSSSSQSSSLAIKQLAFLGAKLHPILTSYPLVPLPFGQARIAEGGLPLGAHPFGHLPLEQTGIAEGSLSL